MGLGDLDALRRRAEREARAPPLVGGDLLCALCFVLPAASASVVVPQRASPSLLIPLPFCQDYVSKMDPASTLGLSMESVHGYSVSHVKRVLDVEPPEMPPCRRGVNNISVSLKGQPLSLGVPC